LGDADPQRQVRIQRSGQFSEKRADGKAAKIRTEPFHKEVEEPNLKPTRVDCTRGKSGTRGATFNPIIFDVVEAVYKIPNQLKTGLYYMLRNCLTQQKRSEIKRWLAASRKRLARAYLLVHGQFTAKDLVNELTRRIKSDFDILMVHSAYDRLLPMYTGTPVELVDELMAFCGKERTLAMPAFTLGGRDQDPIEYYKINTFNVRRTVSEMGLPTEVFRRKPGVKRSLHPTHSVCAFGPLAEELTATHHLCTTRAGKHSPFEVMARKRTVIVGIGIEYFRCLTQAKGVEDILGDEFPIPCSKRTQKVRMLDAGGREVAYPLTVRLFEQPVKAIVLRSLLSKDELIEWRFRGTALWMTFAHRVTECLLEAAPKGITIYGPVKQRCRQSAVGRGNSEQSPSSVCP
jgi:hypothetical protein